MNALEELNNLELNWNDVVAMKIHYNSTTMLYVKGKTNNLETIKTMLSKIDYDCGYGIQELFGVILMEDKSWYERREYNGAEWWDYKKAPTIEDIINIEYYE